MALQYEHRVRLRHLNYPVFSKENPSLCTQKQSSMLLFWCNPTKSWIPQQQPSSLLPGMLSLTTVEASAVEDLALPLLIDNACSISCWIDSSPTNLYSYDIFKATSPPHTCYISILLFAFRHVMQREREKRIVGDTERTSSQHDINKNHAVPCRKLAKVMQLKLLQKTNRVWPPRMQKLSNNFKLEPTSYRS